MWLRCKIMPGQYSGECAIKGRLFDNNEFSLFAERNDVDYDGELSIDKPIDGWLKVIPGPKKGDLLLVSLPQQAFENGKNIIVKIEQVRD